MRSAPAAITRRTLFAVVGGGAAAVAVGVALRTIDEPAAAEALSEATATATTSTAEETPVDRQLAYLFAHFEDEQSAEYGYFEGNDCANFTSQSLLARGWQQDADWWYSHDVDGAELTSPDGSVAYGAAWISSTALRNYLLAHPELGTELNDDARDQVKLGDVVQFDWDLSGDRDHTGVITRIETDDAGRVSLYYAGHTDNTDYRSVDEAITSLHPGAAAYYWSLS